MRRLVGSKKRYSALESLRQFLTKGRWGRKPLVASGDVPEHLQALWRNRRRESRNTDLPILAALAIPTGRWRRPQPSVVVTMWFLVVILVLLLAHVIGGRQP